MAWNYIPYTCSREQAVESSEICCSDIDPLALSKSKSTPEKYCCNGKLTESYLDSLFGMTCVPSESTTPIAQTTSNDCSQSETTCVSAADSLAPILAQPEKAQELPAHNQACGRSMLESFAKYDQDTCSWKTHQCSLLGGLEPYSETWPRWGMMVRGACFPLPMLAHDTSVQGYGSWATPNAALGLPGRIGEFCQKTMVRKETLGIRKSGAKIGSCLKWDRKVVPYLTTTNHPHPNLCEWLMMWPLNWTCLKPLGMGKFQEWQNSHGIN